MYNSVVPSWITSLLARFNSQAGISQAACALTSFLSSGFGPFALEGSFFSKWVIYTSGYFLIQSFQRSIYLENHLLENSEITSHHHWKSSFWIPLLIFIVPLINLFALGTKFGLEDVLFVSSFLIALHQDRYRYLFLIEDPEIALFADLMWLVSSAFLLLFAIIIEPSMLTGLFLIQTGLCPALGLAPLIFKAKNRNQQKSQHYKLEKEVSMYLVYMRIQFVFGTMVAMYISILAVKHLSTDQLKEFKIVQTLISPYQSIANILAISIFARRIEESATNYFFSIIKFCKKLLIFFIFSSALSLVIYSIFRRKIELSYRFTLPEVSLLIVALIGPILMLSAIPLSAHMRRNKMGKQILVSGFAGSISSIVLILSLDLESHVSGILWILSASTAVTVFVSLFLSAIKARNGVFGFNANNS